MKGVLSKELFGVLIFQEGKGPPPTHFSIYGLHLQNHITLK